MIDRLQSALVCGLVLAVAASCGKPSAPPPSKGPSPSAGLSSTTEARTTGAGQGNADSCCPAQPASRGSQTSASPTAATSSTAVIRANPENQVAGRDIEQWIKQLGSPNKEELVEAIVMLQRAKGRAKAAIPRLTALTKHADEEIADTAAQALKAIGP